MVSSMRTMMNSLLQRSNARKEVKTLEVLVHEKNKVRTLYDYVILNGFPPPPNVVTRTKV